MRTGSRLLFFAGLTVGVLAAVIAVRWRSPTAIKPRVVPRLLVTAGQTNVPPPGPRVVIVDAPAAKFTWRAIQTNDFKQYIANLRAIGCPEPTIREIVIPEVSRRYTARLAAEFEACARNFRFWEAADEYKEWDLGGHRREELASEKLAFLKELFGEDMEQELGKWWEINNARDEYDYRSYLPKEKVEKLKAIERRYQRLEEDFGARNRSLTIEEYAAERNRLKAQARAEVAQILTPQELEDYEMRDSQAADYVRRRLPEAKSEEEFRAMVKVAKALNKDPRRQYQDESDFSPEEQAKKKKAEEKAFAEALKTALGEARYSELMEERRREAREKERQDLIWIAKREGMSEEAAKEAHARMTAMAKELEAKFSGLPDLSADQEKDLAALLKQEQEKIILEVMGDKGHNVFKRFEQGRAQSPEG